MISFVGAGPGAADLITIRGAKRLEEADIVVWAASLVPEGLLSHCRPEVEIHDSKRMTLEQVTAVFAANPDAVIVRLHSGDPSVYSAIGEQISWCVEHGRSFEIVPGVGALAATAAAAVHELTIPGLAQSVVLTRLAHRTAASAAEGERLHLLARPGVTMAVFLSAARPDALQDELLQIGSAFTPDTPVVIGDRVSWPQERIVRTTVSALADTLREMGVTTTVLVLVGEALRREAPPVRSHVYLPSFATSFRGAEVDVAAEVDHARDADIDSVSHAEGES